MRDIVKAELGSALPVVVWVGPAGSRAASAGAFITLAAHVAAMAPGTNIGSASPVQMGGAQMDSTMASKVTNDAAAYIASLAADRGRNEEVARSFVTDAVNLTATEARAQGQAPEHRAQEPLPGSPSSTVIPGCSPCPAFRRRWRLCFMIMCFLG